MWKHRWPIVAIALCLGCAPTKGAEESPSPESEATEETPAPEGESTSSESTGSEEKPSESETPAAKTDKPEEKPAGSKKACTGLKKDQCKITSGCAWNDLDKGKCVEEGASE